MFLNKLNYVDDINVNGNKTYIASPFFTESQLNWVKSKERFLSKLGIPYFSPRKSSVSRGYAKLDTVNPSDIEFVKKAIFKTNVSQLDYSRLVYANVRRLDSGTLFEIGYALGNDTPVVAEDDIYMKQVHDSIKEFYERSAKDPYDKIIVMQYNGFKLNAYYPPKSSKLYKAIKATGARYCIVAESTDDNNYCGMSKIIMGYLYSCNSSTEISYFDVYRKSNIMISQACDHVYETMDSKDLNINSNFSLDNFKLVEKGVMDD